MKKKIILILSGIFIYNFLFAQNPFNKKGAWEVNFGLNYYYPVIKGYSYHYDNIGLFSYSEMKSWSFDCNIILIGNVGKYLKISRIMELYKINEKNSLNLLIGLSYNQRKATLKYKKREVSDGIVIVNWENGVEKIRDKYPCLDIKLSGIANLKEKYGIYNAVGFRTNTIINKHWCFCDGLYDLNPYQEYYLTYSLGFLFYLKKINIMFSIDHSIFNLKKIDDPIFVYYPLLITNSEYFNLTNFGISIFFNNPLKNKKNEEK